MTLTELHTKAKEEHWAVPHFNFSDLSQLKGILDACVALRAPVLAGTSEGEREFIGLRQAVALIKSYRETYDIPIFLNADHSHSFETAKAACDAGYDSIHIDCSQKPFEENLEETRKVVEYVKSKNPEIQVEGELGYLVTNSSEVYDKVIEIPEESYTKVDQAVEFVSKTGIDRFAPAIGNLHGIAVNVKQIKFDLVEKLIAALPKNLTFTLHGGSGTPDDQLSRLVEMGFNNIHISTELRVAFTEGLKNFLAANPKEVAPYKYLKPAASNQIEVIKHKLEIYHTVQVV